MDKQTKCRMAEVVIRGVGRGLVKRSQAVPLLDHIVERGKPSSFDVQMFYTILGGALMGLRPPVPFEAALAFKRALATAKEVYQVTNALDKLAEALGRVEEKEPNPFISFAEGMLLRRDMRDTDFKLSSLLERIVNALERGGLPRKSLMTGDEIGTITSQFVMYVPSILSSLAIIAEHELLLSDPNIVLLLYLSARKIEFNDLLEDEQTTYFESLFEGRYELKHKSMQLEVAERIALVEDLVRCAIKYSAFVPSSGERRVEMSFATEMTGYLIELDILQR